MEDRELIRMAAFKLQESARRLGSLAQQADNPKIRRLLETLVDDLLAREKRLRALHDPEARTATKDPAATLGASAKRRAAG